MRIRAQKLYHFEIDLNGADRNLFARELTEILNRYGSNQYPLTQQFFAMLETVFAGELPESDTIESGEINAL
jgi:hypothetical protein